MKFTTKFGAAVLVAVSLALSACATGLPTRVTRYSALPIPSGQTFFVTQANGQPAGLEFGRHAAIVAQHLQARGYRQAASPQAADMLVRLGFSIDEQSREYSHHPADLYDPFYRGMRYGPSRYSPFGYSRYGNSPFGYSRYGYDPFASYGPYGRYGHYYGRPYYSRYGYYGPRSPFYYGWGDPYWGGAEERVVFESELTMNIVRRADNAPLFEGRAQARSQTDEAGVLVPNLIEAMFTGFPGRNGETVRITVLPRQG